MKTKLIIMILSTLFALDASAHTDRDRIVVISDIHLLSPELVTPGSAIDRADAAESKMMAQSDAIMSSITDSIIALHPSLVLITGDLTNNGERLSHERVAEHLARMAAHGIQPLVIPGNHDCNNPYAKRFDGDKTSPAETVTREEFAQIYRDYGYGKTSQRDPASLSYCCEPVKGLVVIGIDSNMDEMNLLTSRGDSTDTYHNGGRIKPETLQWVLDCAGKAHSKGKRVIAMMHHHLVQHFDQEDRLLANYIVKGHDSIARQLMLAGVHTIFTGHLHVTDVATQHNEERSDSIVEVATGSAICYPFAIRTATLDDKHRSLDIDTRWLTATDACPTLREQGRQRIINSTPGMAAMLSSKAWNKLGGRMNQLKAMLEMGGGKANLPENPQQATQLVMRHLSEVLSRALLAVVEGNEEERDVESIIEEGKQGIRAMIAEVAPGQADDLWEFFLNSVYPKLDPLVRSVLEDRNAVGAPLESHADDLRLKITL
jgi:3',5'-cyclic AMP phosphodiesterase CpdA